MAITSQVFAARNDFQETRKSRVPNDELLLGLFVVAIATMLGVAGGLWLAVRSESAGRQENILSGVSVKQSSQTQSMTSESRRATASTGLIPAATAEEPGSRVISLGLPSVRKIRLSNGPDRTELTIELRGAELLRSELLHHPERVYFDFADSGHARRPKGRLKSRREVSILDDRVARVRAARWESGSVRVVVDLKLPCEYSYRLSPGLPSFLILELRPHASGIVANPGAPRQEEPGVSAALSPNRP